ncbi:phage major capsid protein [Pseudonocardia hispaniensis]|uniref:Phage major capsid protein n=1 Tax=Pseudonocardia hispaniensis TaxID=904933 RepID=A0ABW1IZ76_9PSEU
MPYSSLVDRSGAAGDVPDQIAEQITGVINEQSTAMQLGRRVPVSTRDSRMPVLTSVPDAYWVDGDTGLKSTSAAAWENQQLTAEEIAVIVPVPDPVLEDSEFDLWAALRPLIGRAFARRLDRAVLFGEEAPMSWGPGLVQRATTATQTVVNDPADPAASILEAAEQVAVAAERAPTAAVVRPGWQYTAARLRTGEVVANPVGAGPFPLALAGLPLAPNPVYWAPAAAEAIVADWDSVLIGARQDIRFEIFNTGVIQDDTGKIVYNLLQQDMSAMRVTARFGYLLATPATATGVAAVPVSVVTPPAP